MKQFLKSLASMLARIIKVSYKLTKVMVKVGYRTPQALISAGRGEKGTGKGLWKTAWNEEFNPEPIMEEQTIVEEIEEESPEEPVDTRAKELNEKLSRLAKPRDTRDFTVKPNKSVKLSF